MFGKASWMMAIVAALCVAHTHAAQAAKPADAIGTSAIIRDASGKEIGSGANYYDKNGTLIGSEITYFSNAPAAAPAATPAAAAVAAKSADASPKPAYHSATSTIIRDANGKDIGSAANYYDKDGKLVDTKTTYHSNAPAAAPAATPAAAAVAAKSADASPKPAYHSATSTIIRDANGKDIGSAANYYDKDGKLVDTKTTYHSNAPAAAAVAAKSADASKTTNQTKTPAKNTRCHW